MTRAYREGKNFSGSVGFQKNHFRHLHTYKPLQPQPQTRRHASLSTDTPDVVKRAGIMDLTDALDEIKKVDCDRPGKGARMSEAERTFVAVFVTNGGKGTEAAKAAGYRNPHVLSSRLLMRPRIVDAIHAMVRRNMHAALPVALGVLIECCRDTSADWKDRRAAAEAILKMDYKGKATGPTVAVQVNVGKDDPPSEVLRAIWEARAGRMSSIAAPMPDTGAAGITLDGDAADGGAATG